MFAKQKPLSGKRILLTGTRSLIAKQEDTLKRLGAETVDISLIETYPCREEQTQQKLSAVSDYSWIVFASAMGVHQFFAALSEVHVDRRKLGGVKFAVVGAATAEVLESYGYIADVVPQRQMRKRSAVSGRIRLTGKIRYCWCRADRAVLYFQND